MDLCGQVTNMLEMMQRQAGRSLGPIQQHRVAMNEQCQGSSGVVLGLFGTRLRFMVVERSSPGFKDAAWTAKSTLGDVICGRGHRKVQDLSPWKAPIGHRWR